jgi:hypothetical protein
VTKLCEGCCERHSEAESLSRTAQTGSWISVLRSTTSMVNLSVRDVNSMLGSYLPPPLPRRSGPCCPRHVHCHFELVGGRYLVDTFGFTSFTLGSVLERHIGRSITISQSISRTEFRLANVLDVEHIDTSKDTTASIPVRGYRGTAKGERTNSGRLYVRQRDT